MGAPSPYTSSAIDTTDEEKKIEEQKKIEELGEDIHEVQWGEVEIEEPDLREVMGLTTEPSAQPVRDRRRDFPSAANLTIQYLESIGVYDDKESALNATA